MVARAAAIKFIYEQRLVASGGWKLVRGRGCSGSDPAMPVERSSQRT
jgi:hypothetical protein